MKPKYLFKRVEFSGALGDPATLLPLSIGLVLAGSMKLRGLCV
jgi:hypothetical protein